MNTITHISSLNGPLTAQNDTVFSISCDPYISAYRCLVILEQLRRQDIIGYCLILSDISRIIFKFMKFRVAKMYGNNGTFYGGTKIQTQQSQRSYIIRGNTYWYLFYNCKSSITKAGLVSKNEGNFLPLPYKRFIVLPPGRTTALRQMKSHAAALYREQRLKQTTCSGSN